MDRFSYIKISGEMAEWSKALVLKTSVRVSVPWVRIPLSPPYKCKYIYFRKI